MSTPRNADNPRGERDAAQSPAFGWRDSTPADGTPPHRRAGGRTTTTGNGVGHVAPGTSDSGVAPELLTTRQASELANVGERTWWRWSRCGLAPPPVKIGIGPRAAVRYRRSELLAWIDGGCKPVDGRAAQ